MTDQTTLPRVSIVVPTYKEAETIPHLVQRIEKLADTGLIVELLIVDDDSRDGTEEVVASLGRAWVKLIVRTSDRGLSQAVAEGLRQARHEYLVVMDADLSHPPEKIPELVAALTSGADMVFGSRYIAGGEIAEAWSLFRWVNSKVATMLAGPFTSIKDPMAGFFALRRERFLRADQLMPVGFKIGLELLVKCRCRDVREVPIRFEERQHGLSKLNLREQLNYVRHLRLLAIYQYPHLAPLVQFLAVGASGAFVNLAILTLLIGAGVAPRVALGVAIVVSMMSNYALNRRFSFSYARDGSIPRQYVSFVAACAVGAVANYSSALLMLTRFPDLSPQLAAVTGILVGTGFNYLLSKRFVFRRALTRR